MVGCLSVHVLRGLSVHVLRGIKADTDPRIPPPCPPPSMNCFPKSNLSQSAFEGPWETGFGGRRLLGQVPNGRNPPQGHRQINSSKTEVTNIAAGIITLQNLKSILLYKDKYNNRVNEFESNYVMYSNVSMARLKFATTQELT